MRFASCFILFLAAPLVYSAEDTAYTALRVVGKQRGVDTLNHVVEVRGRAGNPAPSVWKVTFEDASARGGLREIEVQHGKIVADRTPVAHPTNAAMNFNQLNLDSDGVFTIANDEAKRAYLPFDQVDYTLKSGSKGGAPVWALDLSETHSGHVATFEIAADSGTILHKDITGHPVAPPNYNNHDPNHDPNHDLNHDANHDANHDQPRDDYRVDPEPSDDLPFQQKVGKFFDHAKEKISHHFEKRRRQFENFFSGKSWDHDQ